MEEAKNLKLNLFIIQDPKDAFKALHESHNTLINNRRIRVEKAKIRRTLFLAKLEDEIGETVECINELFCSKNLKDLPLPAPKIPSPHSGFFSDLLSFPKGIKKEFGSLWAN